MANYSWQQPAHFIKPQHIYIISLYDPYGPSHVWGINARSPLLVLAPGTMDNIQERRICPWLPHKVGKSQNAYKVLSTLAALSPDVVWFTHRLQSSSSVGLPYRILYMNHKMELLRSLWVYVLFVEHLANHVAPQVVPSAAFRAACMV